MSQVKGQAVPQLSHILPSGHSTPGSVVRNSLADPRGRYYILDDPLGNTYCMLVDPHGDLADPFENVSYAG